MFDTHLHVVKRIDLNMFLVQDVNTQTFYELDRESARYFNDIHIDDILEATVSTSGYVMCINYRGHDKVAEKLKGKK